MPSNRFFAIFWSFLIISIGGCNPNPPAGKPASTPIQPGEPADADTALNNPVSPAPAASEPGDTPSANFGGTAGIVDKAAQGTGVAILRDVRTARHDTFDRVVFEFVGGTLPGYHVEYVDRPVRACGSGEVVPLAGDGWLQVRMNPAQAHTDQGSPTITDRERSLDLPVLRELESTCDFEGDVTWVLGLVSPNPYRVIELANPARLVVDVKH